VARDSSGELLELLAGLPLRARGRGQLGAVAPAHGGAELGRVLPERHQRGQERAEGVGQDEEAVQQAVGGVGGAGGAGQRGLRQREAQQLVQHAEERADVCQ
jgi:hypothetical protein